MQLDLALLMQTAKCRKWFQILLPGAFQWGKVTPTLTVAYIKIFSAQFYCYTPASEVSREVVNVTERKNPHTPIYGVREFVCLSATNFDPNYLRIGRTEWA